MAGGDTPSPAFQDYMDLQKRLTDTEEFSISSLRSALKELSDEALKSTYRDLRYISNLKTSYAKGAKKYEASIAPILNRYKEWDEDKRQKFIRIYGKLKEAGLSGEMFKYEAFDLAESALEREDEDEIAVKAEQLLMDYYKKIAVDDDPNAYNEFISKLRRI